MNSLTDVRDVTTADMLNMAAEDTSSLSWERQRSPEQLRSFISGKLANTALADVELDI